MKDKKGFTIIEVLVAMVVLTIGILAMQVMQARSVTENAISSKLTDKSMLGMTQIEHVIGLSYSSSFLEDVDGDGTDQDGNANGIDDDDDGDINTLGIDEEFGLRHWQCCSDGKDPHGKDVAGCTQMADHCGIFGEFNIYWNVAVDQPAENTKTINFIVVSPSDPYNEDAMPIFRAEYTYIKDDTI